MKRIAAVAFSTLLAVAAMAQTPTAELAKPPADARHFVIMSTGGKHGDSWAWTLPDGTRMSRESLNLRGQVWEIDTSVASGTDGMPARLVVRGVTPQGDAAETFTIAGGQATGKARSTRAPLPMPRRVITRASAAPWTPMPPSSSG